jgi:phosphoribosylformimino-5-aminoimidazole carboxamide ribotide isomerase
LLRDEKAVEVIPAIDLMEGEVVRLLRGDPKARSTYEHLGNPVTVAKKWESEGARIIHVIDLDAALGLGNNRESIKAITRAVRVPIQFGGGVRSLDSARNLLREDAERIILGSLAFEDPKAVKTLIEEFGEHRVIVALDHIRGEVMVRGWRKTARLDVPLALQMFLRIGVKNFLVTSVYQDGTLEGPDLETLTKVCAYPEAKIIAAGGIGSLRDLVDLKKLMVRGVIVGKALYEGRFTLKEALMIVEGA